jgi:hypothetical protein
MKANDLLNQKATATSDDGVLRVFISYARPDQAVAEKIEAFLASAGVRVFRDTSDIRAGDNWDIAIENALRECQRGHLKSRKNRKFGRKIGNSIMKNLELVTTPLWNCPYTRCRVKRIGLI